MDLIIQRFNKAHQFDEDSYHSPIADTFSNQSMIQRYIKAHLTNRKTTRILLDEAEYKKQKQAIAQDIYNEIVKIALLASKG